MLNRLGMKLALRKSNFISKLKDNSGQGAVDTAIIVLISIVLGALILAGLYALIDGEVMPTLSQRIKDMFNYSN